MNRIIKFRFWDIDNKVLTQGFTLEEIQNAGKGFNQTSVSEIEKIKVFEDNNNTSTNNGCVLYLHKEANTKSNVEVMQSTGLHDKNGKEIYESDYLDDWCVFWGSGKYILQNISTGDILDCNEENTKQKEITGNRFEHPREHKAMASDL